MTSRSDTIACQAEIGSQIARFYPAGLIPTGDVIWVFGANTSGRHLRGDARIAANHFGAVQGVFSGPTGRAYAIATYNDKSQALRITDIQWAIKAFLTWARSHPQQCYVIARIGGGQGGLSDQRIAPLFAQASSNCVLPQAWSPYLKPAKPSSTPESDLASRINTPDSTSQCDL
jgi:hypothetical protein